MTEESKKAIGPQKFGFTRDWDDISPKDREKLRYIDIALKINILRDVDMDAVREQLIDEGKTKEEKELIKQSFTIIKEFGDDPRTEDLEYKGDVVFPKEISGWAAARKKVNEIRVSMVRVPWSVQEGLISDKSKFFSYDDAKRLVEETGESFWASMGIDNPTQSQLNESRKFYSENLLGRIELDRENNVLSYNPDADFIDREERTKKIQYVDSEGKIVKRDAEQTYSPIITTEGLQTAEHSKMSDPMTSLLDDIEKQVLNDPRLILDGEIIGHLARESVKKGLFGNPAYENQIMEILENPTNVSVIPKVLLEPGGLKPNGITTEQFQDEISEWMVTTKQNMPYFRSYLSDGLIFDTDGKQVSSEVLSGWNIGDHRKSLTALIDNEMTTTEESPLTRIGYGKSIVAQLGNTYTEYQQNKIRKLIGSWGWDQSKSIGANITSILKSLNRDPSDEAAYPEATDRSAARFVKDKIIDEIEREMVKSEETRGTQAWTEEVFSLLDIRIGGSEEEGRVLLDSFDQRVNERIDTVGNQKWDVFTATGSKAAADLVLDYLGLFPSEVSDSFYQDLQDTIVTKYSSLTDALNDGSLILQIQSDAGNKYLEEASENRETMNTPAALIKGIKSSAIKQGFLDFNSSKSFQDHFDTNVVSEVSRRIINAGGVNSPEEIDSYVSELLQAGEVFKSYDLKEHGPGGFTEQFNPQAPPSIPATFEWEGKTYDLMDTGPAGPIGFTFPNFASTEAPYQAPTFDINAVSPELQDLFTNRPDFASFLLKEMQGDAYKAAWEKAAKPKFDEEGFNLQLSGLIDQAKPKINQWNEAQASIDEAQAYIDENDAYHPDTFMPTPQSDDVIKAYGDIQKAQKVQEDIIGPPPTGITPEGEEKPMHGMQGDPFFMFDSGTKKLIKDSYTTAGMSSKEFFESQLPGFEERYRQSPLYEVQKREREEREEAKRRQKVAVGSGAGRGLTIFRRRQ